MTELAQRPDLSVDEMNELLSTRSAANSVAVVCPDSAADSGYLAAGLARRLVDRQPFEPPSWQETPVVLVDGLPGTGGLDVVVDLEAAPGARWGALRGAQGSLDINRLLRALPRRDGVAVLAHDRSRDVVTPTVRTRTLRALGEAVGWLVATQPPDRRPDDAVSVVVLIVRGTVPGMAAAQKYVQLLGEDVPVGVVSLETPASTRALVADSLHHPLVASAATRWKLSSAASNEVADGIWPGSKDRAMSKLLDEITTFVCSRGRSAAWA